MPDPVLDAVRRWVKENGCTCANVTVHARVDLHATGCPVNLGALLDKRDMDTIAEWQAAMTRDGECPECVPHPAHAPNACRVCGPCPGSVAAKQQPSASAGGEQRG